MRVCACGCRVDAAQDMLGTGQWRRWTQQCHEGARWAVSELVSVRDRTSWQIDASAMFRSTDSTFSPKLLGLGSPTTSSPHVCRMHMTV